MDVAYIFNALCSRFKSNTNVGIFWKGANLTYKGGNTTFIKHSSNFQNIQDIIGKTDLDLAWPEEEADFYMKVDSQKVSFRKSATIEKKPLIVMLQKNLRQKRKDNSSHDIFEIKFIWYDENRQIENVLGIYTTLEKYTDFYNELFLNLKLFNKDQKFFMSYKDKKVKLSKKQIAFLQELFLNGEWDLKIVNSRLDITEVTAYSSYINPLKRKFNLQHTDELVVIFLAHHTQVLHAK